ATLYPVPCTGNVHSSVVELALRGGAAGVITFSCPPRDCRGREGPKWLEQRLFHDREAELQARVDKRRVAAATMAIGDLPGTLAAFAEFQRRVAALEPPGVNASDDVEVICEPPVSAAGVPS
ncbi:MAG: hydrogenase iron-sulfur subunit, partial [Gemmatimonadetes bacterium]|nr:hydrogenase iron-sulfur subunit [Gemmatimonadota bacterium]